MVLLFFALLGLWLLVFRFDMLDDLLDGLLAGCYGIQVFLCFLRQRQSLYSHGSFHLTDHFFLFWGKGTDVYRICSMHDRICFGRG